MGRGRGGYVEGLRFVGRRRAVCGGRHRWRTPPSLTPRGLRRQTPLAGRAVPAAPRRPAARGWQRGRRTGGVGEGARVIR